MSYNIVIYLFAFVAIQCVNLSFANVPVKDQIPRYRLDLDKAPKDRWRHMVQDFKKPLDATYAAILKAIPVYARPYLEEIATDLDNYFPAPYADEIRGIAKAMKKSVGYVVGVNLIYEIFASCTSIIITDKDGMIWHARNLEYGLPSVIKDLEKHLRSITVLVDFQRGGKTFYTGVTEVGYVGLNTAQKPNVFTVSIDERDSNKNWKSVLVAILQNKLQPMSFVVRDAMESAETYREAVILLSNRVTIAGVYYIVGGVKPDEGVVITKGRLMYIDLWKLEPASGRWSLVETNFDHWKPAGDNRRAMALRLVKEMGQNVSMKKLFDILSTPPIINSTTIYQTVMSAGKPDLLTARLGHYKPHTTLQFN